MDWKEQLWTGRRLPPPPSDTPPTTAAVPCCAVQGRVTDHRVGVTEHGMDGVLSGERLGVFVEALRLHEQSSLLANLEAAGG